MTSFERITIIANQLANAGKKPTVALIKAKLSSPVPLPQMISALRSWHHEPENCVLREPVATEDLSDKNSDEDMVTNEMLTIEQVNLAISQALEPIKAELTEVKVQLQQLKQNNLVR